MKRRRFLTQTAHLWAAIGLGEFVLDEGKAWRVGRRWQAIAATEGRRLALLVGIDRYQTSGLTIENLAGCKQDVELQQQLLHSAFGFPMENITTVLDEAATGDRFAAELQRLAVLLKPEDCLVVHFSGYGTTLTEATNTAKDPKDPTDPKAPEAPSSPGIIGNPEPPSSLTSSSQSLEIRPPQRAIVLADAIALPLMELSDHLRLLPARNIVVTIDASYEPLTAIDRQELRSRVITNAVVSRAGLGITSALIPNETPIANPQPKKQRREATARPLILTYSAGGLATERRWSDFDAGVLTYLLTQSLWHLGGTSNWHGALAATVEGIERSLGSPPVLQARNDATIEPWAGGVIDSGIVPTTPASVIGTVSAHRSEKLEDLELWLGGLPPTVLSNYALGSIVTVDRASITCPLPVSPPPSPSPLTTTLATTDPVIPTQSSGDPSLDPKVDAEETPTSPESTSGYRPELVNPLISPSISPSINQFVNPQQNPNDRHLWLRISRDRGLRRGAHPLQPLAESLGDRAIFEVVRVIPRFIQLGVALEAQLSRIERVDATSALSGLYGIEAITSSDREADCWFGYSLNTLGTVSTPSAANFADLVNRSVNPEAEFSTKLDANFAGFTSAVSSRPRYTLLTFDRQPIYDCPPEADEAIKRTIRRLQPRLQDLRAFKILTATENTTASMLKVRVTYGLAQTDPTVPDRGLRRTRQTAAIPTPINARDHSTLELPSGSRVQYRIENLSDQPLFFLLVRLDACGRLTIPDTAERVVRAREVLTVPERPEATAWNLERDPGLVRLLAILSDRPFQQTRDSLTRNHATDSRDLARETETHDLSGEVAEAIVADLDRASRDRLPGLDFSADTYALDVRRWATLPLIYRITDSD